MSELGAVADLAQAFNTANRLGKEVGNMIGELDGNAAGNGNGKSNGHAKAPARKSLYKRNGKSCLNGDADFSDIYTDSLSGSQSAAKAPACYQSVMEHMAELSRLKRQVEYHAKVQASKPLQMAEQAKQKLHEATSHGFLSIFHNAIPEPVPKLETLVSREMGAMNAMQKQVGKAVHHSDDIVKTLAAYDSETLLEFEEARKAIGALEKKLARAQKDKIVLEGQLSQASKDDPAYVQMQISFNNAERKEKDFLNKLEQAGQRLVYAHKQSEQVKVKEAVVRAGLHELRLVNSYVTRFLDFVTRTRAADSLIPQLVQTAEAISDSYDVLKGIVEAGNSATTQSVQRLAQAIGTINYTVLPNTIREGKKQQAVLERIDRRTSFYEQAVTLLRGEPAAAGADYAVARQGKQQAGEAKPAITAN
ncbi:hypothetical protein HYU17_04855 [Candidatus Woesearchaeota archaeon]|nr:hypothetical protein [Candidatus Woesearchaeota archaeon]